MYALLLILLPIALLIAGAVIVNTVKHPIGDAIAEGVIIFGIVFGISVATIWIGLWFVSNTDAVEYRKLRDSIESARLLPNNDPAEMMGIQRDLLALEAELGVWQYYNRNGFGPWISDEVNAVLEEAADAWIEGLG